MKFISAISTALALSSVGCSTITQSDSQGVSLTALYKGQPTDAQCQLSNDRGNWNATAPSNVNVRKSNEDLQVTCKKDGMPDGILKAISRAAGSMWGNIIFGGGIGALIDHTNGKGYDYPDRLPVVMGESTIVDKRTQGDAATAAAADPAQSAEASPSATR